MAGAVSYPVTAIHTFKEIIELVFESFDLFEHKNQLRKPCHTIDPQIP